MPIVNAIIHNLTRNMSGQRLHVRETNLDLDDLTSHLLNLVKPLFIGRAGKRYGCFHEETGAFKGLIGNWRKQSLSFESMTQKMMEQLAMEIEQQNVHLEGHWLIAEEQLEATTRLWICQLKHKDGLLITPQLSLAETHYIDFAKIGFCGCLDMKEFDEPGNKKFFTVSFGFGDRPLMSVLLDFLNFTDTIDTSADTERFMNLVKDFSKSMPEKDGKKYQTAAAEYCIEQEKNGETVNVQDISYELENETPVKLEDFIKHQDPEIKQEFIPDRKSLKKYVRYIGKNKEVSISFSNDVLGEQVKFDPGSETLTFTNLPDSLVKQLKES